MTISRRLSLAGVIAALMGGIVTSTAAGAEAAPANTAHTRSVQAPAPSAVHTAALYQKHVKSTTYSVSIFTSPTGQDTWGTWYSCQNFYTDRTDGSRYHTWVNIGGVSRDAWVTSSSNYVASGWC